MSVLSKLWNFWRAEPRERLDDNIANPPADVAGDLGFETCLRIGHDWGEWSLAARTEYSVRNVPLGQRPNPWIHHDAKTVCNTWFRTCKRCGYPDLNERIIDGDIGRL